MRLSVVAPLWQDRPAAENVEVGVVADELGFGELWVGEMATYDAFALATAIGLRTEQIELAVGPLAAGVRTPMTLAMGAASVADLTGRRVGVALGTSSDVVVSSWHGRARQPAVTMLNQHAEATRQLLSGERAASGGQWASSKGYRLRLDPPGGPFTVAAFGPKAIEVAARHGDRMLLNMVTPELAGELVSAVGAAAERMGRPTPRTAVWLPTAADASPDALGQFARGIVAYLGAPGYGDMFAAAGFGDIVDKARSGVHPKELLAGLPSALIESVSLIGGSGGIEQRLAAYRDAGIDEVCLVPATADDPAGRRTLTAYQPWATTGF